MTDVGLPVLIAQVRQRRVSDSGFMARPACSPRVDATCWAILSLSATDRHNQPIGDAQRALAAAQLPDGRVCVSSQHKDAFWPTPLAMLAWHSSPRFRQPQEKAARFLLGFDQMNLIDDPDAGEVIGHDPTIKGWPWISGTSPWLEPTACCLMALRLAGFESHGRTEEARRLILDRQLPAGGWNYGNTVVYGQELRPMPETTGMALQALAGVASRAEVAKSIEYLKAQLPRLTTPFALGWALLGLAAWGEAGDRREHIDRVLARQEDPAAWDTVSLSLLILAWHCEKGLFDWLQRSREEISR